jgi:hypothetical protein
MIEQCPAWCETDHHRATYHASRLWAGTFRGILTVNRSPAVSEFSDDDEAFGPYLELQFGESQGVPVALDLSAVDARALAAALLQGVEIAEAELPGRCACGEPVKLEQAGCLPCELKAHRTRRPMLRALNGGAK